MYALSTTTLLRVHSSLPIYDDGVYLETEKRKLSNRLLPVRMYGLLRLLLLRLQTSVYIYRIVQLIEK